MDILRYLQELLTAFKIAANSKPQLLSDVQTNAASQQLWHLCKKKSQKGETKSCNVFEVSC